MIPHQANVEMRRGYALHTTSVGLTGLLQCCSSLQLQKVLLHEAVLCPTSRRMQRKL